LSTLNTTFNATIDAADYAAFNDSNISTFKASINAAI
jgi:hypothetical protein